MSAVTTINILQFYGGVKGSSYLKRWVGYSYKCFVWIFVPDCRGEKTDMKLKILL